MSTLYFILICVGSLLVGTIIGMRITLSIWKPKDLLKNAKGLLSTNDELLNEVNKLTDVINKANLTIKSNYQWYCNQLFEIGKWVKDKYKDDYIIEELKKLPDYENLELENLTDEEKLDKVLDKIKSKGIENLDESEKKFLNNLKK